MYVCVCVWVSLKVVYRCVWVGEFEGCVHVCVCVCTCMGEFEGCI